MADIKTIVVEESAYNICDEAARQSISAIEQNTVPKANSAIQSIKIGTVEQSKVDGVVTLPEYPTVPTNVSAFTNDSGYLTSHQDISGKVDKVTGKELSTNDFTDEYKNKLDGIASGAQVNVKADWNAVSGDAMILNKPTLGTAASTDVSAYATSTQGSKADSAVQTIKINNVEQTKTNGVINLPAYPTTLPASDVSSWAKATSKPTYTASEVGADTSGSAAQALKDAKDYTDTEIANLINGAPTTMDTLKEIADAMEAHVEVVDALDEAIGTKADALDLSNHTSNTTVHITSTERATWNGKYAKPTGGIPKTDLASAVQTSLGKADTALQSYTEKYTGTVTGIMMNGVSKGTKGVVDLGTVITSHQDISGKADASTVSNHINDTTVHVTSSNKETWNAKYSKPSTGIPKTDLASAVQTSLGKADTALQSHQDISGKANNTEAGMNTLINKLSTSTSAPTDNDYFVSQYVNGGTTTTTYNRRPLSALWTYIKGKVEALGYTKNTGTITGITMNGSSKGTSGVVNLGTVITSHQNISGKADKLSITAGTAGTSTATSGLSLSVPYVTVNTQGLVSAYGTHTHTMFTDVTGTLSAGATSITLSNSKITTSSTIDVYTSIYGVNPTNMTVTAGKVVLTFDAQPSNMNVKIRIS